MRLRNLRLLVFVLGLALLDAPLRSDAAACAVNECLTNSALSQRVQPTSVNTDDRGDVTFFSSQSGQLPNVLFILDNSTSMYELPYDVSAFPNAAWTSKGATPAGSGASQAGAAASCHSNTYFEGLKDPGGNPYNKATTYAAPDPAFPNYFASASNYKYMEWTSAAAGGAANGTLAAPGASCNGMSTTAGSGGSGGSGATAWSMTQRQRCQQCLDEAGYYLKPSTSGSQNDVQNGSYVFKGNWLNFNPPKFLIARKVLTDFITRQSIAATPVRIGVVTYDVNNVSALDYPSVNTGLRANDGGAFVSSGMVPDCGVIDWNTPAAQAQQGSLVAAVRSISFGSFAAAIATPLAETLFNVGQFFSGDNTFYTTKFGAKWTKAAFTAPTGANKPLCASCQASAVVLITDGEPFGDNNLPQAFRDNTITCAGCGTDQYNGSPALLDDVSNFLATNDLSPSLTGIQDVVTFVIGVGLQVPLLDNAAKFGKSSRAMRADSAQQLQDDVTDAVVNIVARATAFSSTAIQTLEVGTGSTAYVPRFVPGSPIEAVWDGHLFRFDLFNEFVAGVDKNNDGNLNGVFLVDKDGDIITEDDKGAFHKLKNNAPAVPVWDAGAQLNATSYATRSIYTAVWDAAAGAWATIPFTGNIGDPNFAAIASYLGIDGTNACAQIQSMMAAPIPAAYLPFDRDHCAKAIIDYVRGQNILNEVPTTTSVTVNRPHMLGDIFHSSPVVVDPPVDQFICSLGLHAQCVSTLYGYQNSNGQATPMPTDKYTVGSGPSAREVDAYEKFWQDNNIGAPRPRIVIVGANDGMLHAFDAGSATSTPGVQDPQSPFRRIQYGSGDGHEVWAFVPPDQLPRLWLMLRDGHQLYMDGDIMVRDVWVDGKPNNASPFTNKPMVKQDVEYHTVAIASERQGGNHFVALDVTDTATPKMLWMYPPPCSPDEQVWGQTWGQFSPRPPPIGPVLLETTDTAGPPNYGHPHTQERWAVFLNGGHDPFNNRGRAAAILDVYTGVPLFKATYDRAASDATAQMRFGFPATPALVDYGHGDAFAPDGFFDTAVLGDEGGQIWAFRFPDPGHLDSATGLVDNWTFGRAYEPRKTASDDTRFHQPIYAIAATTVQPDNGWLRAYAGSGDRAHVRSTGGGDCRPDDPISCVNAGCSVNTSLTLDNGPNHYVSSFTSAAGSNAANPLMASPAQAQSTAPAAACTLANANENITVSSCPAAAMSITEPLPFSCGGSPYSCSEGAFRQPTPNANRAAASTAVGANSFVSVAVLADATGSPSRSRRMSLPAQAGAYDSNRLSAADLVDVTATTATTTAVTGNTAGRSSAGWTVSYSAIDEKTVTSSTILGGCVIWSSLIPTGGAVGCASAGATIAPFYQADALTGAPNCAASFLSGSSYVRSIQRNVLSPPPEPAAAVAIGPGGSSLRFSTLEIQPGAQEVTQMTVSTSTEMLQMLYSMPLTVEQHACRHVDATQCP